MRRLRWLRCKGCGIGRCPSRAVMSRATGARVGGPPPEGVDVGLFQVTSSGCRGGEGFDPGQRIAELLSAAHERGDDPPLVAALVIVLAAVNVVGAEAEHPVDEAGELVGGGGDGFGAPRRAFRRRWKAPKASDCGRGSWRRGGSSPMAARSVAEAWPVSTVSTERRQH